MAELSAITRVTRSHCPQMPLHHKSILHRIYKIVSLINVIVLVPQKQKEVTNQGRKIVAQKSFKFVPEGDIHKVRRRLDERYSQPNTSAGTTGNYTGTLCITRVTCKQSHASKCLGPNA